MAAVLQGMVPYPVVWGCVRPVGWAHTPVWLWSCSSSVLPAHEGPCANPVLCWLCVLRSGSHCPAAAQRPLTTSVCAWHGLSSLLFVTQGPCHWAPRQHQAQAPATVHRRPSKVQKSQWLIMAQHSCRYHRVLGGMPHGSGTSGEQWRTECGGTHTVSCHTLSVGLHWELLPLMHISQALQTAGAGGKAQFDGFPPCSHGGFL